jgi:hypothetical protein
MPRSSLLIAGSSVILLSAMTSEGAAAGPRLSLTVSSSFFYNAQISSCQYRDSHNQPCNPRKSNDCRCVRPPRLITGGGGTPGTVEVRPPAQTVLGFIRLIAEGTFPALGGQGAACESAAWRPSGGGTPGTVEVRPPRNTIKGGGGTPGTVEVRPPD